MEAESLAEVSKVNMEIELIKKEYSKKIQEIESYCIKKDLIHLIIPSIILALLVPYYRWQVKPRARALSYPPAGTEYHIFGEMTAAVEEVAIQKGHCFGRNTSNFYIKLENEKNTLEKFFPVEFKAGTPVINRGFFYCTTKDPHKVSAEKTLNDGKALSVKQHKKALCPVKIPFRFDGAKGCYILTQ